MNFKKYYLMAALIISILLTAALVQALTIYKYKDKNGTTVMVQDLSQVPPEYRDKVQVIKMGDQKKESSVEKTFTDTKDKAKARAREILTNIKGREIGKKQVAQGRALLKSFLKDKQYILIGYVLAGIVLFIIATMVLKKSLKSMVLKILLKVVLVGGLMAGIMFFYLSYMSQNLADMTGTAGAKGKDGKTINILTSPKDLLDQVKEIAGSMDKKIRDTDNKLKQLDEEQNPKK